MKQYFFVCDGVVVCTTPKEKLDTLTQRLEALRINGHKYEGVVEVLPIIASNYINIWHLFTTSSKKKKLNIKIGRIIFGGILGTSKPKG